MELHRPLIYLIGLDKGLYQVVHPVYVTADSPDALTFRIEADAESWVFDENLLDATHVLEDHHERGLPEIPNGLALCKIHHSAYEVNILGVSPD